MQAQQLFLGTAARLNPAELLLEVLDDLGSCEFKKLKWHLMVNGLDSFRPIPRSRLENAYRMDIVDIMLRYYGAEMAVNITMKNLRKISRNDIVERLKEAYTEERAAKPSTSSALTPPAAPAVMSAYNGSVIFAPAVNGGISGPLNITINCGVMTTTRRNVLLHFQLFLLKLLLMLLLECLFRMEV
ncbi:caspase b-like [Thunnus maccoyii]|uniref:caspase b-like n=1 Tax=Thunnus maccoyii TaxID=8240 RepID=UPI001C4B7160|nr:caspase b-like [Thunnus maccoyii]